MTNLDTPDSIVVKKILRPGDNGFATGSRVTDWGRGTLAEAEAFCRRPAWPADPADAFVALDEWGHGKVVAATRADLIGLTKRELFEALQ